MTSMQRIHFFLQAYWKLYKMFVQADKPNKRRVGMVMLHNLLITYMLTVYILTSTA